MKNSFLLGFTAAGAAAIVLVSANLQSGKDDATPISFSKNLTERSGTEKSPAQRGKDGTSANMTRQTTVTYSNLNWQSLEQEFIKAPSFRAFFYNALKHPEQGGYYYALKSLSVCKNLPKLATGDLPEPRLQAATELKYRCDFTDQDYDDAQRQLDALRDFRFSNDPLFSRMFEFLAASDQARRADIVKLALIDGNPDVIASIVYPSLEASAFSSGSKPQIPPKYLKFASSLIACELGADCGPNSTRALELCVHTGWCGASVPEALRSGLGDNFGNVNALVKRTVDYVRNEELDKLSAGFPGVTDRATPRTLYKPAAGHSDTGSTGVHGIASGG